MHENLVEFVNIAVFSCIIFFGPNCANTHKSHTAVVCQSFSKKLKDLTNYLLVQQRSY